MRRDKRNTDITALPGQGHDPEVVAEAMREGVPVARLESGDGRQFGVRSSELPYNENNGPIRRMMTGADPVFTGTVDVMREYDSAMEQAKNAGMADGGGPITEDAVREATATLNKYKQGKARLELRLIDNEEYFRLLHNGMERGRNKNKKDGSYDKGRYRRNTAWLFSSIANKVADFQDNFPEPTVTPRELNDEKAARQLTAIIPAILERNKYREVYRQKSTDKVKNGTGIEAVVWDPDLCDGMGDIALRRVDPLNIFWEPGISDIQQSANIFTVELRRNDELVAAYPQIPDLKDRLGGQGFTVSQYTFNSDVDNSEKSYVINWYYKRRQGTKMILHYCRYVNDVVLYASENDPRYSKEGWYRHGRYPFVFDVMYSEPGTPYGFGQIDICRDAQDDIDDMNNEIMRNVKTSLRRRYFSSMNGGINEEEFMDLSRDIVHVQGPIDENSVKEIAVSPISAANLSVYQEKINEMKETGANRDVTQGGSGGTSTASGIAALIETGNKVSRDMIASSYEAFKETCELVIELIRQFYDVPRSFRILGEDGQYDYQSVDNSAMQGQTIQGEFGIAEYQTAEPVFDVSVKAAKNNPWSKQQQNQDAMNLLGLGFFNPENYKTALACLECMDMENIDKLKSIITDNGTDWENSQMMALQQQIMALQQQLAAMQGGAAPSAGGGERPQGRQPGDQHAPKSGGGNSGQTVFDRAQAQTRAGTQPR